MAADMKPGQRAEMETLLTQKSRMERSVRQQALFSKILKRYRVVHVTASNIMFAALILHIVFALMFQVS